MVFLAHTIELYPHFHGFLWVALWFWREYCTLNVFEKTEAKTQDFTDTERP